MHWRLTRVHTTQETNTAQCDAIGFACWFWKLPDERILLDNDACLTTIPKFKLNSAKDVRTMPGTPQKTGQGRTNPPKLTKECILK